MLARTDIFCSSARIKPLFRGRGHHIRSDVVSHGVRRLTSNIVRHLGIRRKHEVYSTSNSWSSKYGGNRPGRIF
ncbi:hypothetical protein RHECNPAF_2190063 [Rhizobium etli CNPAF512]|nr:hypothetical protein RHECNPAF_2190063 [Rhizobium etli CNPAF512]